jgi:predicted dehydrogenase
MTDKTTRRSFLKTSSEIAAVTAAVSTLGGVHTIAQEKDAKLGIGIIGCGGIMTHHVQGLVRRREAVEIAWLCDVDPAQIERMSKQISDGFQAAPPKRTPNYEDVINDKNVDAVIIATPHHWHAPIAIVAMQAGKDCYIEKPISHVFNEGHAIIKASKKYGRVVQQGSQMRNSPVTLKAERLLKEGLIGEVKVAKAWTAEMRSVSKPLPDSSPPTGADYDRWLGPAPSRPFNSHRWHGTWRMFQDYGNGEIGDDGIHDLDMACWGLGVDSVPVQITARGHRMMLHGHASEYPDNMIASYEYEDGRLLIYENYPFTSYGIHGFDNGNVFYGTEGYMVFSRRGAFSTYLGPKGLAGPTEGKDIRTERGYAEHMKEFLSSIRTRKMTKANPQTAHYSCALVHLGEIAYRTSGRVDFDPQTETFKNNDEANALLTKEYRKPFVLPDV